MNHLWNDTLAKRHLFVDIIWLRVKIDFLLIPFFLCLCVIDRILQGDTLLLGCYLLLLLHLEFLMYLLGEMHVEFGRVLGNTTSLRFRNRVWIWLVGPSWATSMAWHRWYIVNGYILFLRKWRFACKVWRDRLVKRLFSNRFLSLVISHKNRADSHSCSLKSILSWIEWILLLRLGHSTSPHEVTTCGSNLDLLSVRWTDIQWYLNDIFVVIMNVNWRYLLSLLHLHTASALSLIWIRVHLALVLCLILQGIILMFTSLKLLRHGWEVYDFLAMISSWIRLRT